jgi:ATP-binding protein involved in chromosome partitioning
VRHTIAVSSGKGGVGKSTVAVNLAIALQQTGASVGLIDADVYGPDVPLMLGAKGKPGMVDNRIIPVHAHGLAMMSIGLLVSDREPLVWRGPMIHSFIQQMLRDVMWGALDYLLFDMPPGTGDAQLSLSQVIPLGGVVMVTTPGTWRCSTCTKAIGMFSGSNAHLGVMENMSRFVAPDTGTRPIFGEGRAARSRGTASPSSPDSARPHRPGRRARRHHRAPAESPQAAFRALAATVVAPR